MSKPQPGPSTTQSRLGFDVTDLANYESFMCSLITFMNESAITIQQVKERSGIAPGCSAPVKMNDEDKQQKMTEIVMNLTEKYQEEASTLNNTTAQDAMDSSLSAHNTAFLMPNTPCACPPDNSQNLTPPSRLTSRQRGRKADTARPGTSPARGRVAAPDPYFMPLAQSTFNTAECPAIPSAGSKGVSQRERMAYSPPINSGRMPGAYSRSNPFDMPVTGRGPSGYSNAPSSGWSGECPKECTIGSVNSTGRQQYRNPKGAQNIYCD